MTDSAASSAPAEIMAGRGSFIESFPLFDYNLDDYNQLFSEKLDLLLTLRESEKVTWSGEHRPALQGQGVYPRMERQTLRRLPVSGDILFSIRIYVQPLSELATRPRREMGKGDNRPRASSRPEPPGR